MIKKDGQCLVADIAESLLLFKLRKMLRVNIAARLEVACATASGGVDLGCTGMRARLGVRLDVAQAATPGGALEYEGELYALDINWVCRTARGDCSASAMTFLSYSAMLAAWSDTKEAVWGWLSGIAAALRACDPERMLPTPPRPVFPA